MTNLQKIDELELDDAATTNQQPANSTSNGVTPDMVNSAYTQWYNVAPTTEELNYWTNDHVGDPNQFNSIFASAAQQNTNTRPIYTAPAAPAGPTDEEIWQAYSNVLGRTPEWAGLEYWRNPANSTGGDFLNTFTQAAQTELANNQNEGISDNSLLGYDALVQTLTPANSVSPDTGLLTAGSPATINIDLPSTNDAENAQPTADYIYEMSDQYAQDISNKFAQAMGELKQYAETKDIPGLSHHLENILSAGSPLMDQAMSMTNQHMAGRGLLNTSLNTQASQAALIDQAYKIAAGNQDSDIANATAWNESQRALMNQFANLASQGISSSSDLFSQALGGTLDTIDNEQLARLQQHQAQYDAVIDAQQSAYQHYLDSDEQRMAHMQDLDVSMMEHGQSLERDMLEAVSGRATEMLRQNAGLHAQYLNGWSNIVNADMSLNAKKERLDAYASEMNKASASLGLWSEMTISSDGTGGFVFNMPNNALQNLTNDQGDATSNNGLDAQRSWEELSYYLWGEGATDGGLNEMYSISGGDSPQEETIEDFERTMNKVKDNPDAMAIAMSTYDARGLQNDDWENTLKAIIDSVEPWVVAENTSNHFEESY